MKLILKDAMPTEERTIPEGWNLVPVSQLIQRHFSGPSPDCEEREIASEEEWGVLKTTAITWAGWNEKAHKVLPRAYWGRHDLAVEKGDVVVTKAGPRDRVAVVAEVTTAARNLIVSGKMIALRPHPDEVLPKILANALALSKPQEYIHARTTGMAESQVNFANTVLLDTKLPIPRLDEQFRIAAVIQSADMAISHTEVVTAKLSQMRAGLLHDLLTRGIDERGELRDPVAHPEQFKNSVLGRIPREWEVKTCESLSHQICVGIVVKPAQYYVDFGVPTLRSANVRENAIDPKELVFISPGSNRLLYKSMLRSGDVVTVRTGYPGTTSVIPESLDGSNCVDLIITRPKPEINPHFLSFWVNSPFGKDQILKVQGGLAQQHFNVGEMNRLLVARPSTDEQARIVSLVQLLDTIVETEEKIRDKLILVRRGLRSDLLNGRIRVPETLGLAEAST